MDATQTNITKSYENALLKFNCTTPVLFEQWIMLLYCYFIEYLSALLNFMELYYVCVVKIAYKNLNLIYEFMACMVSFNPAFWQKRALK